MTRTGKFRLAVVSLAAAAALLAEDATAQGFPGGHSWYVRAYGGATLPRDDDFRLPETPPCTFGNPCLNFDSGLSYDTGYVLGIAAGLDITPHLGVEFEYTYRNADAAFSNLQDASGTTESNAWMVNALYRFAPLGAAGAWQPYAGGGIGAADLSVDSVSPSELSGFDGDYAFAYQLIGGVAYRINPHFALNGEVRFFGIGGHELENDFFSFDTTYQTFDLLVGATYHF